MANNTTATKKVEKKIENELKSNENIDIEIIKQQLLEQMKAELELEKNKIRDEIKEQMKSEVEKELKSEVQIKEKEIKTRQKVDLDKLVNVRSVCAGSLTVKTKLYDYDFSNYGDIQEISIGELKALKSSRPRYFTLPLMIVDDEEAVEVCGLTNFYEKISYIEDLPNFFNNHTEEEVIKTFKETPQYLLTEIGNRVLEMWNDKSYKDVEVAQLIERLLGIDIIKQ